MPNSIAYLALLAWPVLSLLFISKRDPAKALTLIVVGGYLLLPVRTAFDAPFIPPIDKNTIIAFSAFLALGIRKPRGFHWLPKQPLFRFLYILYFVSPVLTVLANNDPLIYGPRFVRGLELYDVLGVVFSRLADLIPFSLAMNYLATRKAQITFLKWLVILGLGYSLLVLIEIRLSPQLHTWIYGFFPHSFGQQMRGDGFRAVVFLGHGLEVSFLLFTVFAAAVGLWKEKVRILPVPTVAIVGYLFIVLLLNKSVASVLYGVFFFVACISLSPKRQLQIAAAFVIITLSYPVLRSTDIFPTQKLISSAMTIGEDRAQSLKFRFDNEDILLEKALARPLLGWGTWGRNRVYSAQTGDDQTVTDGTWIILLGSFGWIGFLAMFGLLFASVIVLYQRLRGPATAGYLTVTSTGMITSIIGIELLPNSSLSPVGWLFSGSLLALSYLSIRKT